MQIRLLLVSILITQSSLLFSQESHSIHQNHMFRHYDRYVYNADARFHTSVKPFQLRQVNEVVNTDSLYYRQVKNKFWDIVWNRSLIQYENSDFAFTIDPIVNFELGKDNGSGYDRISKINTRGFLINASIGDKFSMTTSFYENQASFNDYRFDRIDHLGKNIIPGQGRGKAFGDSLKTTNDYAFAEAYISYSPNEYFNFQFGHGKNSFGDGYRSLLLSDNSFNYPFFKITTDFWNIKYVNLWAQFQDLTTNNKYGIANNKKWGSFQYLDWNVTKWLSISFFEAVIWANADSTGVRGFDFNYANPVIFLRPVEFSVGSPDNALMGVGGKLTLFRKQIFYGQFILDEFKFSELKAGNGWWANKYGLQLGYKTFDLFNLEHLDIQTEFNYVRPFMYSHLSTTTNYGHYNQPLAHPLGSNFWESVSFLRYNYKRIFFEGRISVAVHGSDTVGANFGNDIWKDYSTHTRVHGNNIAQYNEVKLGYVNMTLAYLVNPAADLNVYLSYTNRRESSVIESKNQSLITFGIRTSLGNFYYDW